ncbi:Flavin-containing monooxygenase YUCCA9 [Mycena kentingensis (nom. inval.)]|nr:Flavin-containing monooxygenase YUCCA9 [Mycena kentingensis (nom. inval.)]
MDDNAVAYSAASAWLDTFGSALASRNVDAVVQCFHPDGVLRDILAFSWNNRSLEGRAKIAAYLRESPRKIADVQLDHRPWLKPEMNGFNTKILVPHDDGIGAAFTCRVDGIGPGQGYFFLARDNDGDWKAVSVFTRLVDIAGHEEWLEEYGVFGGHTLAWVDVRRERREKIEKEPYVLISAFSLALLATKALNLLRAVGAGQTGLNLAAQMTHMNIPVLVVENNARVGDNWRKRYPTLSLHTTKFYGELLYQPYPATWPIYAAREKIADWLEQYVITQDLVVWTNSRPTPGPKYDPATRKWTVVIDRAGERVTLYPAHIVVTGVLGAPRIPALENQDKFNGTILHSIDYVGAAPFAGKRVVVIGAGNTSADICQDLVFRKAAEVTMVQRSSTTVIPVQAVAQRERGHFPPGRPTAVSDFMLLALPVSLQQRLYEQNIVGFLDAFKDLYGSLEFAGFKVNTSKEFFSLFYSAYGGYSFDVGCASLITSGQVRVKQGVEPVGFRSDSLVFSDETNVQADVVIFATSYERNRDTMRSIFGDAIIDQTSPAWGLDEEGELRGCWRPSGHPGLWFGAGEFFTARAYPKQLALQIKAIELGLMTM